MEPGFPRVNRERNSPSSKKRGFEESIADGDFEVGLDPAQDEVMSGLNQASRIVKTEESQTDIAEQKQPAHDERVPSREAKRSRPNDENTGLGFIAKDGAVEDSNELLERQGRLDAAERMFGVGWRRLQDEEDPHVRDAARGHALFISKRFASLSDTPLDVEIVLKQRTTGLYLIQAKGGYYLFPEDLRTCQLVATTWKQTMENIRCQPTRFQDTTILRAGGMSPTSMNGSSIQSVPSLITLDGDESLDGPESIDSRDNEMQID